MVGGASFPPIGQLTYLLTLPPYGFYWFYLADASQMPAWHVKPVDRMPELQTLVLSRALAEIMGDKARQVLERESLPVYLLKRRWFSGDRLSSDSVQLRHATPLGDGVDAPLLVELAVSGAQDGEFYNLPVLAVPEYTTGNDLPQQLALARLRRGRKVELLTDAFSLPRFVHHVLRLLHTGTVVRGTAGEIQFVPEPAFIDTPLDEQAEVKLLSVEQSNSSAMVGDSLLLKLLRRGFPGIHPEVEMGRFLSRQGYSHIAPFLGEVLRVDEAGIPHTLLVLQRYLDNQGDAWTWTLNSLDRAIRDELSAGTMESEFDALAELKLFAGVLGKRVGEMHAVLARPVEDPDFGYRPSGDEEQARWTRAIGAQVRQALTELERVRERIAADAAAVDWLLTEKEALLATIGKLATLAAGGILTRVHGDLHLGQVLVVQGDAYLIDFEGEPSRPLDERRQHHSPMKDVSGMLRSFDYAAAVAWRNACGADPTVAQHHEACSQILARYRTDARNEFLQAYRVAASGLPHEWHGREGEGAALALFSLEKAAYEFLYESDHRPDWLDIPFNGLLELARHLLGNRT